MKGMKGWVRSGERERERERERENNNRYKFWSFDAIFLKIYPFFFHSMRFYIKFIHNFVNNHNKYHNKNRIKKFSQ